MSKKKKLKNRRLTHSRKRRIEKLEERGFVDVKSLGGPIKYWVMTWMAKTVLEEFDCYSGVGTRHFVKSPVQGVSAEVFFTFLYKLWRYDKDVQYDPYAYAGPYGDWIHGSEVRRDHKYLRDNFKRFASMKKDRFLAEVFINELQGGL